MEKKAKALWLYSVLIFAAAILLIIISALSQTRLNPITNVSDGGQQTDVSVSDTQQQAFTQTVDQGVVELIKQRDEIVAQNSQLKTELEDQKTKNEQLTKDYNKANEKSDVLERLIWIQSLIDQKDYETAFAQIKTVNADILSDSALDFYHDCLKTLEKKGYRGE